MHLFEHGAILLQVIHIEALSSFPQHVAFTNISSFLLLAIDGALSYIPLHVCLLLHDGLNGSLLLLLGCHDESFSLDHLLLILFASFEVQLTSLVFQTDVSLFGPFLLVVQT